MKYPGIILMLILCWSFYLSGQEISPPELLNATIINESGDVKLSWKLTDTLDIDIQILRDYPEINAYNDIHVVSDTSIVTWVDKNSEANAHPRSYMLKYNLDGSPSSNKFNTVHTTLSFDTCKKTIKLNWTRHVPKNDIINFNDTISIKQYNVWKNTDAQGFEKVHSSNDTIFTDQNVEYNHAYTYYIEAVREKDTAIKSASNRVSIYTRMPYNPDYINPDRIISGNSQISLQFTIAENSELKRYKLLRGQNVNGPFDTIHSFNTSENTLEYQDNQTSPKKKVYYYYVLAINQCHHPTTTSDTVGNIDLQLQSEDVSAMLEWNNSLSRIGEDIAYNIYRKNGINPYGFLTKTYTPGFLDSELDLFSGRDSSSKFCYYIQGEAHSSGDLSTQVRSDQECIYIKPSVFIPNAFTPNGDNKNDSFRPYFSFLPQSYRLIIYNRQGNKVFETHSPQKAWKGTYRGQHKVNAGTYIYYIEVKNPKQEEIKKRGEINVLYP